MGEVALKTHSDNWSSWIEIYVEHQECSKKLKEYRSKVKKKLSKNHKAEIINENEILGSMLSDMHELVDELKQKILYEFNVFNDDDINNPLLTENQKKVLILRKEYSSCTKIGKILGMPPNAVFEIYKQALKKLIKHKSQEKVGVIPGLSPQQEKIYILYKQGKKRKEIAEELNLSINSVKTQLKRIKEKEKRVTKLLKIRSLS